MTALTRLRALVDALNSPQSKRSGTQSAVLYEARREAAGILAEMEALACQSAPDARSFGDKIVTETERLLELESGFLVSLAANNLPPDIAELLVRGNPMRGIPPRLIQKAIKAAIAGWNTSATPVAWMNDEHIDAYLSGKRDGIAWAAPNESDFYNVALYAATKPLPEPPALAVKTDRPFYGAECPSYPDCSGGCGLGCTKKIEAALAVKTEDNRND